MTRLLIGTVRVIAQAIYALMRLSPRRRKVVLFSRQADRPSHDFLMLAEEIGRRDPSVEIVIRCRRLPDGLAGRVRYVGEVLAQMWHLSTASVCVVDGYCIPVSMLDHDDGLRVVQIWHALGAFKRIGLQAVGKRGGRDASLARSMRMHRNYDLVLCGGPAAVPVYAEAFGVPEACVLPLGLPRVDCLVRHAKERHGSGAGARRRLPAPEDDRSLKILYAPTYRHDGAHATARVIEAFASTPHTLVVKPHDAVAVELPAGSVVDATGVDVTELLLACDVVITDYSGVACEASILDLPLYFYVPDYDEYVQEPGLNLDPLTEFPTVTSRRIEDIVWKIDECSHDPEVTRSVRERFVALLDGTCTMRIAERILSLMPGERGKDA